jgi:mono/diheme cytochrome c family protein
MFMLICCQQEEQSTEGFAVAQQQRTRREIIGEKLYQTYCAGCHSETGEGDGLHSFALNPPPANHADSALMNTLSDKYLFEVVSEGGTFVGKSPEMPRWKYVLNENQIWNIIVYIRTLPDKQRFPLLGP